MVLMMMWMLLLVTMTSELFQMMRMMMLFVSDATPISEVVPGLIGLILNGQGEEKRESTFVLLISIYECLILHQTRIVL